MGIKIAVARRLVITVFCVAFFVSLSSCGAPDGGINTDAGTARRSNGLSSISSPTHSAPVSFSGMQVMLNFPAGYRLLQSAFTLPSYVTKVTLTITGEGMDPLVLDVPLSTLTVDFIATPGVRTFTVTVDTNIPGLSFTDSWTGRLQPGGNGSIPFDLEINAPPQDVTITASSTSTFKRTKITITVTAVELDPEDTLSISWNGGGGSMSRTDAVTAPAHNFGWSKTWSANKSGSYSVCATLDDGKGGTVKKCVKVEVVNRIPVIDDVSATLGDDAGCSSGKRVSLTCTAHDPDLDRLTYKWSGSDGFTSNRQKTSTCASVGTTTYTCTADDGDGGTASDSASVTVTTTTPATTTTANNSWVVQFGTATFEFANDITVDASGNIYLTGATDGDIAGTGNAGVNDIFLAKYDSSGNRIWIRQIGTTSWDVGTSVAVDGSGNVFMCGNTRGMLGGTPGGSDDAFLAKYNSSGTQQWLIQLATSARDLGRDCDVDSNGDVYMVGTTGGVLGAGSAGGDDIYITKYNPSGTQQWIKQIGTTGSDSGIGISVDGPGNSILTGDTNGNLGGTNSGGKDAYLAKYDTSGNQVWLVQFGTASDDTGIDVVVDGSGNSYATGETAGAFTGANAGGKDVFTTKYNNGGVRQWIAQKGSSVDDTGYGIAVDGSGNSYIGGTTDGDISGAGSNGGKDVFVLSYSSAGTQSSLFQFGTAQDDSGYGLAVDTSANIFANTFTTGETKGTFPGNTSAGSTDVFFRKN